MSLSRTLKWVFFVITLGLLLALAYVPVVYADKPDNRPPDNRPPDRGSQPVTVSNSSETNVGVETNVSTANTATAQGGSATATGTGYGGEGGHASSESVSSAQGGAGYGGQASASNEGVTVEGDRVENNSTNVVLVPNNNTANCMRVFGISFGNGDGAAGIGYPHRDRACDFEQAADDAAATGNHKIAWWWRCHKKALYKTFKTSNVSDEQAQLACWNSMMEMLSIPGSDEPVPTGQVIIPEEEYESLMMAQVQQEEFDEALEKAEYRFAQQESLIDELKSRVKEHETDSGELERLKKEAAELRERQQAEEQQQEAIRAKFKSRLVEREQQIEEAEKDE